LDFQLKTKAIFVGEETGGKASHFGEVRSFKLPASGLEIAFSTKYFYCDEKNEVTVLRTGKEINAERHPRKSILPDRLVELRFEDFENNTDPVLKWVIEYRP